MCLASEVGWMVTSLAEMWKRATGKVGRRRGDEGGSGVKGEGAEFHRCAEVEALQDPRGVRGDSWAGRRS